MSIMTASLHRSFFVFLSCLATFCLCQQQRNVSEGSSSTEVQTRVGWVAGPTQRGTLRLVYGCLSTIFACTWTVLHLNVPGQNEPRWKTSVRKLKWMAITILFPEFMFAKAICELRLAVADLAAMHKVLRENPVVWTDTQFSEVGAGGSIIETTVSWGVDFNSRMKALHRLFRLPAIDKEISDRTVSSPAVTSPMVSRVASHLSIHSNRSVPDIDTRTSSDLEQGRSVSDLSRPASGTSAVRSTNSADAATELQQIDSSHAASRTSMDGVDHRPLDTTILSRGPPRKYEFRERRLWTLSHSIYANMGGLIYISENVEMDKICSLLASTLTYNIKMGYSWVARDWRSLALSEDDIQDKSKADWLLKTIVCFQITWLVLTALSRAIIGLPVTQLEIATVAFAVLAVATFMANWWKPKDVARPTPLPSARTYFESNNEVLVQSFSRRILKPSEGDEAPFAFDRSRITNDTIWMDGQPPIALVLLSVSSMIFGGLHVLAWNSDFPSDVERMLWRVSIVAIATLPAICLSMTFFMEHLALVYIPKHNPDEWRSRKLKSYCDAASRCIAISNAVVYAIARLLVLVIMFTALRSVESDTYNEIVWTNYVPSFS